MDFKDSPDEAEFRSRVQAWLKANAGQTTQTRSGSRTEAENLTEGKAWQATKALAGFACIAWPKQWGGVGGTPIQQVIFDQEEEKYGRAYKYFGIGLGMCIPTILTVGDEAAKVRFARPAIRGEEIWCQLFSEPAAGSDVAAIRTKAVQSADGSGDWIVNGQKVWTSGAHYSDYGLLLTRTDADVPKHKGLTMFWVNMKSPGVDVRPIHQASGESDFNEVYFSDVCIPDSQRLGEVGRGWEVALVTLMNERVAVGGGMGPGWKELLELASGIPSLSGVGSAAQDAGFRQRLARWHVAAEGLRYTRYRTLTALGRGEVPGPESSIGKVVLARQMQEISEEAINRLDQYGILDGHAAGHSRLGDFQHNWFWGAALRIAGGSDEILKNIIAERVLGLPQDVRVDREIAFKDLPRGA